MAQQVLLEPEKRSNIDWSSLDGLKKSVRGCKDRTTRACSLITKLVARPFTFAALDDARQYQRLLNERMNLLADVFDQISDLQPEKKMIDDNAKTVQEYQTAADEALDKLSSCLVL